MASTALYLLQVPFPLPEPAITELATRLQAVVGDTYRVVRELGGGGMSRVFLAEEPRLGRQVVIKVLPPEMGAGVNVGRFEREIQLAARLQHPHIVPLLTAGASGDLLYYVMPFIAGESLRVKLAGQGELPILEAMRILRDVADALAYAHANGVVHRDIKPDNVLLSAGHAVVTDFGVAKAVSASSGEGHLTSLGLALGTPAYMAPEQAAADPHVDHRADIYALGALAYEMLCGRPPFTANSPQALLAAHITQAPDAASHFRPSISPVLNAVVMRCLEKRAADRWQTANELVAQLDAASTPSAGLAPSGVQTVISSGTESALRRSHPVRVAGLFIVASVIVLAAAWILVQRLGLPDWVMYAAAALLAIGLPIMLVTSLHERRRVVARTTQLVTPASGAATGLFTWKKALTGGALAFGGLAVVAAAYTAMRLLGIGPVGTLVASGVLKDREQILLADFENRAADSTLGPSVTEAFRVDLSQSPTVRVMDQQTIAQALTRMQRPATGALPTALAKELAEREGVKAVVTGQIDPVGQGYVLAASLISSSDGRTLSAVRETAEGPGELLKAIDRLSAKLRERIGESLTTIRANPALDQVTTGSLPALRRYSQGLRLEESDQVEDAISAYQEAVALDTGFAMAWRKLAVMLGNTRAPNSQQVAAATRAFQHRDRLPSVERDLATGYYYTNVDYEPTKTVAAYRSLLSVDPDNLPALNNLSIVLMDQHQWAEAESLVSRASHLGRGASFYNNLMQAQVAQGHFADAHATLDRYAKASPQSPSLKGFRAVLAMTEGKYGVADSLLRQIRQEQRNSRYYSSTSARFLAGLEERQGRLAAARRYILEDIQAAEAAQDYRQAVEETALLAGKELLYGAKPAAAIAAIDSILQRHPLTSMDPMDRPYGALALAYASGGRVAEARKLITEMASRVPAGVSRLDAPGPVVYGVVAEAEGKDREALAAYMRWNQLSGTCVACGLYESALIYDRLGKPDSALALLEQVVATRTVQKTLYVDSYALAPSLKRLGELYETKGDKKKAAEYYSRFVDLWKNADTELQPTVRDVRTRLARLAQEPGA